MNSSILENMENSTTHAQQPQQIQQQTNVHGDIDENSSQPNFIHDDNGMELKVYSTHQWWEKKILNV